jgi:hypothetical protein
MNQKLSLVLAASIAIAAPAIFGGCTIGESSLSLGSVSSLSGSSLAAAAQEYNYHYSKDVRAAVQTSVAAGASEGEVLRSVGRVAERHGVSDWESQPATYVAMGEGLKLAGEDEASAVSLSPKLTGGNEEAAKLLLGSYRS